MSMFQALDAAMSGATLSRTWLDAISDNVANVNTVNKPGEDPFRARLVIAQSKPGDGPNGIGAGVGVAGVALKDGLSQKVLDPDHPYADDEGYVSRAVVDLSEELTNMVIASRAYQANLSVLDRVRDAYKKALEIGAR